MDANYAAPPSVLQSPLSPNLAILSPRQVREDIPVVRAVPSFAQQSQGAILQMAQQVGASPPRSGVLSPVRFQAHEKVIIRPAQETTGASGQPAQGTVTLGASWGQLQNAVAGSSANMLSQSFKNAVERSRTPEVGDGSVWEAVIGIKEKESDMASSSTVMDENAASPMSPRRLLHNHEGPTSALETVVYDLQKSVVSLMSDSENAAESQRSYHASLEDRLREQEDVIAKVSSALKMMSSDLALLQEKQSTLQTDNQGCSEGQFNRHAEQLEGIMNRLAQQDEAINDMSLSRSSPEGLSSLESRCAKLEKHLPEMMVEQDLQCRIVSLENHVETLLTDTTKIEQRFTEQAGDIETVQASLNDMFDSLKDVCLEDTRPRLAYLEEKINEVFTEALTWSERNQECMKALDARLTKSEDAAAVQMSATHWESIHLLCDNMQVEQQQQQEVIDSLRSDRTQHVDMIRGLHSEWLEQMDFVKCMQSDAVALRQLTYSLESEKSAVEERFKSLEDMSSDAHKAAGMNAARIESIHELIGHLNAQQDQHATVIHGLQSEIHSLLREYIAGMPPSPGRQSPELPSEPQAERSGADLVAASLHGQPQTRQQMQPQENQRPANRPSPPRSPDTEQQGFVMQQHQSFVMHQQEPSDIAIDSGDLHPDLLKEIAKFPQFQAIAAAQNNLRRLPQLR